MICVQFQLPDDVARGNVAPAPFVMGDTDAGTADSADCAAAAGAGITTHHLKAEAAAAAVGELRTDSAKREGDVAESRAKRLKEDTTSGS